MSAHALRIAARARDRRSAVAHWIGSQPIDARTLVIAPSLEAGSRALRSAADGRPAAFGWQRATLAEVAARLASEPLAAIGCSAAPRVVLEALCARVIERRREERTLGRFARIAEGHPGFARALARSFAELRMTGVDHAALEPELGSLFAAYVAELRAHRLADRADVLRAACERATQSRAHPLLDLPIALLDVAIASPVEVAFVAALAARSPRMFATVPSGDDTSIERLARALDAEPVTIDGPSAPTALDRLAAQLFAAPRTAAPLDRSVELFSAPGESRECVEIARRALRAAETGIPFDRMAILTHAPDRYRAQLVEALRRARIEAYFSRGTLRPDPAGRALIALLACKEERLSARAFAEYLSLAVVPDAEGAEPSDPDAVWRPPEDDLYALPADDFVEPTAPDAIDPYASVSGGTLRAPWRWERLLVDAAVIGGLDRWERRLDGLANAITAELAATEDPDDPRVRSLERRRDDLAHLRAFAMPLLEELDALPARAPWATWSERLAALASRAIKNPGRILSVLRELAPMGSVADVGLTEVRMVLARRLAEMVTPPSGSPAGKIFVASIDEARGLSFDVVFVPGLAEKIFPRKVIEDPILLDAERARISPELPLTAARVEQERLALRLAIGAAERQVVLSYPRLDTERGRPRVPSFYGLEVLRAIEGTLPSFEELSSRAEDAGGARMAWPAPLDPNDAVDGAEFDLAVLHEVLHVADAGEVRGAARYLMAANPHLARSLRARHLRWNGKWSKADGLVNPSGRSKDILTSKHAPAARAYSATALEQLAACPYRFYLRAIAGLEPPQVPEALEELDPRSRGRLLHEVQARVLGALRDEVLLPIDATRLPSAQRIADAALDAVAARWTEELAPAIERVWRDAVEDVRTDVREWLLRMAERPEWVPVAFELAFGIPIDRRAHDPASTAEPVILDEGLVLRGAIDLVEQRAGELRATDHKSGIAASGGPAIVAGGRSLQAVLYARALEKLYPDRKVVGGRLYYCTARGRFEERFVPLDRRANDAVAVLAETLNAHVERGFFPAAPSEGECKACPYLSVCGPAEERRVARKPVAELGPIRALRRRT